MFIDMYINHELPDVQAAFRKGRGTRDQIANICGSLRNKRIPEKHLLLLHGASLVAQRVKRLPAMQETWV